MKSYRGSDPPRVTGYGAVYWDGTPQTEYVLFEDICERCMPGCFDRAIKEDDVRACYNHDTNFLLGRKSAGTLELRSDTTGLNYEILPPATRRDVVESIRRRDVTGSSFSFLVRSQKWVKRPDGGSVRELHDVELFDVGPVCFPAYTGTTAQTRSFAEGQIERRFLSGDICPVFLIEGTHVRGRVTGSPRLAGVAGRHRGEDLDLELELADAETGGDRPRPDPVLASYLVRAASILE